MSCALTPRTSVCAAAWELGQGCDSLTEPVSVATEQANVTEGAVGLGSRTGPEQCWLDGKEEVTLGGERAGGGSGPDPVPSASSL